MILFIILGTHVFGYFLTLTRNTNDLTDWVAALPREPLTIMAIILFGYIILGVFIDQIAILIRRCRWCRLKLPSDLIGLVRCDRGCDGGGWHGHTGP